MVAEGAAAARSPSDFDVVMPERFSRLKRGSAGDRSCFECCLSGGGGVDSLLPAAAGDAALVVVVVVSGTGWGGAWADEPVVLVEEVVVAPAPPPAPPPPAAACLVEATAGVAVVVVVGVLSLLPNCASSDLSTVHVRRCWSRLQDTTCLMGGECIRV